MRRCWVCHQPVTHTVTGPLPADPNHDPLGIAQPCGHTAGTYVQGNDPRQWRPGVDPQLWVGLAAALLVLAFISRPASCGHRGRRTVLRDRRPPSGPRVIVRSRVMTFDAAGVRSRRAAATPGQWFVAGNTVGAIYRDVAVDPYVADGGGNLWGADAALIAHAPTDLAAALDRISKLEDALAEVHLLASTVNTRHEATWLRTIARIYALSSPLAAAEGVVEPDKQPSPHPFNPNGPICNWPGCGQPPEAAVHAAEGARLAAERGLAGEADQFVCQRCGGANVVWFAPNKLWNEAMGREGGIVCPSCFVRAYEAATGERPVWRLAPNESEAERGLAGEGT